LNRCEPAEDHFHKKIGVFLPTELSRMFRREVRERDSDKMFKPFADKTEKEL
jgi:hypothetical protein